MPSKERVKFHVFSRNGLQLVVVIHRGGCFSNEKLYCLSDQVVNFDVGSQCASLLFNQFAPLKRHSLYNSLLNKLSS